MSNSEVLKYLVINKPEVLADTSGQYIDKVDATPMLGPEDAG